MEKLLQFFDDFIDMVQTALVALKTFHDMLDEFDQRIVAMVDNCGSSEFNGLPVNKAIATYHYAVGDVVFYLMYMVILIGCLFTIYKIVLLIFKAVRNAIDHFTGGSISSVGFTGIISKLFKG